MKYDVSNILPSWYNVMCRIQAFIMFT